MSAVLCKKGQNWPSLPHWHGVCSTQIGETMSPTDGTIEPVAISPQAVYTTRQAATALQCSVSAIRRACASGRLAAGRGCGSWRILGAHLVRWATGPADTVQEPEPGFPELTDEDIAALCGAGGDE